MDIRTLKNMHRNMSGNAPGDIPGGILGDTPENAFGNTLGNANWNLYQDRKPNWHQRILVCIVAALMGILSLAMATKRLSAYIPFDETWRASGYDLLNVVFVTNDTAQFPYIDRKSMSLLTPLFSYYMAGIWLTNMRFLTVKKSYFPLLFARISNRGQAFAHLRGHCQADLSCYAFVYSVVCYLGQYLLYGRNGTDVIKETTLAGYVLLHAIAMSLFLMLLHQAIFLVYLESNAELAFLMGICVLLVAVLMDMQSQEITILLFVPRHYFMDGIGILVMLNLGMKGLEKAVLKQRFLY